MEYTVLKPLAHNGRLYKPGEKLTDLPEKAKLDRWVQNRVVSRGMTEGEAAVQPASTTPPVIPPTTQQTPPVIPPATQQTPLQDSLLDKSRAELDAMLLALGQTEAQVKALKNKNKAAVVELIRTLEKEKAAVDSGEGTSSGVGEGTGSAIGEGAEAGGETYPGGTAGEGGEAVRQMTKFQEILENDLNSVFFNGEEFATEHNIDGQKVSVVVDNDLLTARKIKAGRGNGKIQGEGIFDGDLLFFVPSGRLEKPKVGQIMRFDGYPYRVTDASELDGMLTVTLKGNFT